MLFASGLSDQKYLSSAYFVPVQRVMNMNEPG